MSVHISDDTKIEEITIRALGDHPIDKYLLIEVETYILCAKQPSNKGYFETVTGLIIPIDDVSGWLEEVSEEYLDECRRVIAASQDYQLNNNEEIVH